MARFIGNNTVTFDIEKISIIYWNIKDHNDLTYAEVRLIDGNEASLYFTDDDDFQLITPLRQELGLNPLPRIH